VKGRTFYQNGPTWTDAQGASAAEPSSARKSHSTADAYFALLQAHPESARGCRWGNEIDLVLGDTLYVIR
jgi:hypothetical protein